MKVIQMKYYYNRFPIFSVFQQNHGHFHIEKFLYKNKLWEKI